MSNITSSSGSSARSIAGYTASNIASSSANIIGVGISARGRALTAVLVAAQAAVPEAAPLVAPVLALGTSTSKVGKVPRSKNDAHHICGYFFNVALQGVLLFGSKSWNLGFQPCLPGCSTLR